MKEFNELIQKADFHYDKAYFGRKKQSLSTQEITDNFGKAMQYWKLAVEFLLANHTLFDEQTKAIYCQQAAATAYECGEFRECERIIALSLCGNPPASIAINLRKLWQKALKEINKLPENMLKIRATEVKNDKKVALQK
jgi:hypothetical protein